MGEWDVVDIADNGPAAPQAQSGGGNEWDVVSSEPMQQGYGQRQDGMPKGQGFLGELQRPDGGVSTELTIGVNLDGKDIDIPSLVPTLTEQEKNHLLGGGRPTREIVNKAVDHAIERKKAGEGVFADYALKEGQPASFPESGPMIPGESTSVLTGKPVSEQEMLKGGNDGKRPDTESFVRPALEFGGMAAGGAIASPTGPAGSVAGAGLGYAAGRQVANKIDEALGVRQQEGLGQELVKAGRDVAEGAVMEAGGQVVGKVVSGAANSLKDYFARKFSPSRIAAETLRANTTTGKIFAKNTDEAAALESEISGLKLTPGQATGDPARMKLERGRAATSGDAAVNMQAVRENNEKALSNYILKKFGGNIDAAFARIDEVKQGLDAAVSGAKKEIDKAVSKYGQGDIQLGGQSVRSALQRGRDAAKGTAKAMYDEIPEGIALKSDELSKSISSMTDEFKKSGDAISDLPRGIIKQIDGIIRPDKLKNPILDASGKPFQSTTAPKEIDFKTLRGIRSQIGEAIGDASRGANPNYKLSRRLATLRGAVEKTLDQLEKQPGQIGEKYKAATKFYREAYVPKWRKGTVADVLKPGNSPEGFKVGDAEVLGKVFRPGNKGLDAADQLLSVSRGNDDVLNVVKDYAEQRLLQEGTNRLTGEVTEKGLANFTAKYGDILRKFGIDRQFKNFSSLQNSLTSAIEKQAAFEKSAAGALLKADPETAISKSLLGSGSQRQKMSELVYMVKDKPEALSGLKRAMIDHITNSIQPTAASPFAKSIRKYDPALKELFKDNPAQLAAMHRVRRAYEVMNRTSRGTTGGADTAEKLSAFLQHLAGGRTSAVLRVILGPFKDHIGKQSDDLINKSLYDPDLARALLRAANGDKKFDGILLNNLTKISAVAGN